ncbi:SNF2-related protein [Myxococcus sp. CA010]|uniref:SNF2-related protein n=1 Tax=unclassified Myxococcus TaxID=2648731 RepID=UPI0034CD58ED
MVRFRPWALSGDEGLWTPKSRGLCRFRRHASLLQGGAQHAGPRVALTGTPVENRLSELWRLYALLFPGSWAAASPFVRASSSP